MLLLPYVALSSCANLGEKESVRERGKGRVGERERERRERREEREERGERGERRERRERERGERETDEEIERESVIYIYICIYWLRGDVFHRENTFCSRRTHSVVKITHSVRVEKPFG